MSSSARIDELRKKFDENPRRFFAPLANEYRKAGDFEQAVFICQEYLPQQPGHMSGHIVYGQTLFDMGRDEEARAVFETALTLDPENLIALKHLGDISRQAGDLEAARSWYQRVLEADPRNDEIMQILESMGGVDAGLGAGAAAGNGSGRGDRSSPAHVSEPTTSFETSAESPQDDTASVTTGFETSADDSSDTLVLEQSVDAEMPVAPPEAVAAPAEEPPPLEVASEEPAVDELLDVDDFSFGSSEAVASSEPSETPAEPEPAVAAHSLDIMAFTADSSAESNEEPPELPVETELSADPETAVDVTVGFSEDIPVAESSTREAVAGLDVDETPAPSEDLTRAIDQLAGLETFSMDAPVEASVDVPAAPIAEQEVPAPPAPDTFATETMAELYAQQGHLESALEIYDQLIERSPDDAELRRRAEQVARQMTGALTEVTSEPAQELVTESIAMETTEAEATGADAASPVLAGPTIREFLMELFGGRGAGDAWAPDVEPAGGASPSESEGSLDIMFSEAETDDADLSAAMSLAQAFGAEPEERADDAALRGTPARQATDELSLDHVFRAATPAKGSAAAGGSVFSLDQFFAGEMANADHAEGGEEGAPRSSDDIAQFNAWLNGLKKT